MNTFNYYSAQKYKNRSFPCPEFNFKEIAPRAQGRKDSRSSVLNTRTGTYNYTTFVELLRH
uniref:Uncharacterized protein n=1 Tax=Daucus carota subsp. sativus TaxID=79200 RepID=A0A175YKK1_DAUCS